MHNESSCLGLQTVDLATRSTDADHAEHVLVLARSTDGCIPSKQIPFDCHVKNVNNDHDWLPIAPLTWAASVRCACSQSARQSRFASICFAQKDAHTHLNLITGPVHPLTLSF